MFVFYLQYDERRLDFSSVSDTASLRDFVLLNRDPLITNYTLTTASHIFTDQFEFRLFLFADGSGEMFPRQYEALRTVAAEYRLKVEYHLLPSPGLSCRFLFSFNVDNDNGRPAVD